MAPSDLIASYLKHYKSKGLHSTFVGKLHIHSAQEFPDKLEYYVRLVRKHLGHLYLIFSKRVDKYNGSAQNKDITFDLGVRTFCSGYDPDGIFIELRKSDISGIHKFCRSIDKL